MADPEAPQASRPRKVTAKKKAAPKKAAPKRKAASKKAAPKKAAPRKAAPKREAASKKAAPRKAAPKRKAASKKAAPRKAAPKRVVARSPQPDVAEAPTTSEPTPTTASPGAARSGRATPPSGRPDGGRRRWALAASITEELLNDLVFVGLGDGVSMDPVEQEVNLPGMGEVRLRLGLTVTGVRFELRADDGGRARVTVLGAGDVDVRASDYEGDVLEGAATGFPTSPAPLPVALVTLAEPFLELREDHTVSMGLDLRNAELVSLGVDLDAGVPEGVDASAWAGILQMTSVMFTMMGGHLFEGLASTVSSVGTDLGDDVGVVLADLGVAPGLADTQVGTGTLSFGLPARDDAEGRAVAVPVAGKRLGVAVARSGVERLSADLFARAVGGLPLPFELEIDLGEQKVGSRLRQPRVISERFPDLRSSLRTEVKVRLVRGRLELGVAAAWIELPSGLPKVFNVVSRRLGGLVSMAPLRFRFPSTIPVPIVPGSDERIGVRVDDLRVSSEGVGVVVAMA